MRAHRDQLEHRAKASRNAAPRAGDGAAHRALALQSTAGNRAVSSIVARKAEVQRTAAQEDIDLALRRIEAILDPEALGGAESGSASTVQASRAAVVQRQEPEKPPEPKAGKPGDVVKAVLATPEGKEAIKVLKEKAESDVKALKPGEKAAVVSTAIVILAPAVTAAMIQPDSRSFMLDQVSGKKVSIPGLDGVSAKIDFKDGKPTGGMVYFNVGQALPKSWGFK